MLNVEFGYYRFWTFDGREGEQVTFFSHKVSQEDFVLERFDADGIWMVLGHGSLVLGS